LPLAFTLSLSALLHGAVFFARLPEIAVPSPTPQFTLVDLTSEPPFSSTPAGPALNPELQLLQSFRSSALQRTDTLEQTLTSALNQQTEAEAARQQRVAALEAAHSTLTGQFETLTVEKAELAAQLADERQRTAELEQQLQEKLRAKEAEISGVKGAYDRLVAELKGEISQKEIALRQVKDRLTVTIVDRILFPSGQATLTAEGRRVMNKVGTILAKMSDRRILIEGHTDNVPIGETLRSVFPTNWELSTARATEVVKYLIAETKLPAGRLSAVGRADTAPVSSNATEEERARNRRIEIILLPLEDQPNNLS
jgi:chemotaxis protein MotB